MRPPSKKDIYLHTVTRYYCGFTCGRLEIKYLMVILCKFYLIITWICPQRGTFGRMFINKPYPATSNAPVITTAWRVIVRVRAVAGASEEERPGDVLILFHSSSSSCERGDVLVPFHSLLQAGGRSLRAGVDVSGGGVLGSVHSLFFIVNMVSPLRRSLSGVPLINCAYCGPCSDFVLHYDGSQWWRAG